MSDISALKASPWYHSLAPELQRVLTDRFHFKTIYDGQYIHRTGDAPNGFYGICQGQVRVSQQAVGGREILLALLDAGSWFGEISSFDKAPRTHDAVAAGKVTLAVVSQAAFDNLLSEYPAFYPAFARMLCSRVRGAFQFIDASALLTQRQQLLRRLIMLSTSYGQQQAMHGPVTLTVSQESMAHMINASRQTVNRLLQQLVKEELIEVGYGRVHIPDPARLAQYS